MELIEKYFPQLTAEQLHQLRLLKGLYEEWNAKINVISRKDLESFYEHHVLHSLSIAKIISFKKQAKIMDIGTGGGFPGIPLAILSPETHFVLADSIGKKIKVTQAVADALQLKNAKTFAGRVESWEGEKFDAAITRAVAPLSELAKWAKKILKQKNDGLICLKGGNLETEIKDAGLKTKCYNLSDYFRESFFETKLVTISAITVK